LNDETYEQKKARFDRMLTVYGRKAVLETLRDASLQCHALHLASSNRQHGIIGEILDRQQQRIETGIDLAKIFQDGG